MSKIQPSWHGFHGQIPIVSSIREHIEGSLSKGRPLPHVLLAGGSGLGKTELSRAISAEYGSQMVSVFASPSTRRPHLCHALASLKKGDLLFIDEAHQAPTPTLEMLFPAIDRHEIPVVEDGKIQEGQWRTIEPWTLVLATNQPGLLLSAIKTRVPLTYVLQPYGEEDLIAIIRNRASKLGLLVSAQAARRIAKAARGSPRKAGHFLESLHVVHSDPEKELTRRIVSKHFASLLIDEDDLREEDRMMLKALFRRGSAMSVHDVSAQVGVDEDSVRNDIEPFLVKHGWVAVEARGRTLTDAGREYVAKRGLA